MGSCVSSSIHTTEKGDAIGGVSVPQQREQQQSQQQPPGPPRRSSAASSSIEDEMASQGMCFAASGSRSPTAASDAFGSPPMGAVGPQETLHDATVANSSSTSIPSSRHGRLRHCVPPPLVSSALAAVAQDAVTSCDQSSVVSTRVPALELPPSPLLPPPVSHHHHHRLPPRSGDNAATATPPRPTSHVIFAAPRGAFHSVFGVTEAPPGGGSNASTLSSPLESEAALHVGSPTQQGRMAAGRPSLTATGGAMVQRHNAGGGAGCPRQPHRSVLGSGGNNTHPRYFSGGDALASSGSGRHANSSTVQIADVAYRSTRSSSVGMSPPHSLMSLPVTPLRLDKAPSHVPELPAEGVHHNDQEPAEYPHPRPLADFQQFAGGRPQSLWSGIGSFFSTEGEETQRQLGGLSNNNNNDSSEIDVQTITSEAAGANAVLSFSTSGEVGSATDGPTNSASTNTTSAHQQLLTEEDEEGRARRELSSLGGGGCGGSGDHSKLPLGMMTVNPLPSGGRLQQQLAPTKEEDQQQLLFVECVEDWEPVPLVMALKYKDQLAKPRNDSS